MTPHVAPVPLRWAMPLAAGAGGALWLAFPPTGWWPLALVGVGLLSLACNGQRARRAFGLGLLTGFAFFLPLIDWLTNVGVHAWLILAVTQALATGLLGVGLAVTSRLTWWPLAQAGVWVLYEATRGRFPVGGFTWGRIAFSQTRSPFTEWAAVGGAPLLSFVTTLVALAALWALYASSDRARIVRRGVVAASVLAVVAAAAAAVPVPATGERRLAIAAVQGNVPALGLERFEEDMAVLRNHVDATRRLASDVRAGRRRQPALVVWPENSTDIDPRRDGRVAALVQASAKDVGAPILVGAVLDTDDNRILNAGLLWEPATGAGQMYVKQHLVPYGEYVPLRKLLGGRVRMLEEYIPRDFVAGKEPGVLDVGGARVGDVICFEVAYDGLVRNTVRAGAQVLVVQTNNATYMRGGNRSQTEQQLEMGRLRAIEHGRTVVVAATSGVSALIGPDGSTLARSGLFTQEVLAADVPVRSSLTLATRVGAAPELLACLLALVAIGLGVAINIRASRGTAASAIAAEEPDAPGDRTAVGG
jgi:apolipoprotein N-acyltransferase